MSGNKTNFLLTGATGYIGGCVLMRFLAHPRASTFQIMVLVRDAKKAEKLMELGVDAVVGSHKDAPLVEKLASEADVVIAMADSDDLGATNATLAGLRKRHALTGTTPIFIHTSGAGVLMDDARGMFATTTIYDDSDADQIESLAPTQLHRDVDLTITNADAEGYIQSYIIMPSAVYGRATGRLVDLGIQNTQSMQIPMLVKAALDRGRAGVIGAGKNIWPHVEVHDVADLFVVLYDAIVAGTAGHGRNGFYFGESGESSLYDVGKAIGDVLVALGRCDNPEPTTFSEAEIEKYFGGTYYLATNARCRATRSLSIGWKPVKTARDMVASVQPEVEVILKKMAA